MFIWYLWIKIIHILSAAILFGTGLGTAFYMYYVNLQKNIELIAKATALVVVADWLFTVSSGFIQGLTGLALVYLNGYSFLSVWVLGSIMGYLLAGLCWLPVVWLQMRCRDMAYKALYEKSPLPALYHRYFRIWFLLGIPAFILLIGVFYLMTNKPDYIDFSFMGGSKWQIRLK